MPAARFELARPRALMVRGGWEGHEPVATTELFLPVLEQAGFSVEIHDDLAVYDDEERLAHTDLIVQCWSMGHLSDERAERLAGAVRAGTGFAGWHGGVVAAFKGNERYWQLTGGVFVAHPGDMRPHSYDIVAERADHPIVAGLGPFHAYTEQYWVLTDDLDDVLVTTTHPADSHTPWPRPVTVPAVWTRQWGAGRVFVSTIGHHRPDFDTAHVHTLTARGLLWAGRAL
ncbi:ThuA domain-containing protein [Salinactinospora qingdaonensis]|uniref:ThuA domain-containing protein n=1 Tax=Salinactinospora qingdaonensis TaxID=702744 RepID=A0ABP7FIH3_9ACTN